MIKGDIENIIFRLYKLMETNDFQDYDLFDGLTSPVSKYVTFNNKVLRQIWQYFFKVSPVNFRKLFGIKKILVAKTLADIIISNCLLYKLTGQSIFKERSKILAKQLLELRIKGYSGDCWGVNIEYQSRSARSSKDTPNIVTTYYCGYALYLINKICGITDFQENIISIKEFILRDLGFIHQETGICFRYYPSNNVKIHNANLFASAFLTIIGSIENDKESIELAKKGFEYSASCLLPEGKWYYGEDIKNKWADNFHTAYNINSFYIYKKITGDKSFDKIITNAKKYYIENFFLENGIVKYYDDKIYPIDMQCIAQSIETLSICFENKVNKLVDKIIEWSIKNMYSNEGYFYYQKRKFFINKSTYYRWVQSPMLVALSYHLLNRE